MRIAVVSAACEFPDSQSPSQLWQTVLEGRRCFRTLPSERLHLNDYAGHGPDSIYPIQAALLADYRFDRAAFRIPQSLFERTDMAHWLALDVATRAWQGLNVEPGSLGAERTAVIVANTLTGEFSRANLMRYRWPYVERVLRSTLSCRGEELEAMLQKVSCAYHTPFPAPDADSLAGSLTNTIAGRIANHHGLQGGAHTVDGACASSLVAVVSACEKLAYADVDCVLVGAVDLSLDPFELVGFARNGAMARTTMRVFDARSEGFWPGEGCGFVVLATEEKARNCGWPVLGWIRGAAMSSDGEGSLTLPTAAGQLLASRRAWRQAQLDPGTADYFEAHGTGTPAGDPIELDGLAALVGAAARPVPVGSIKALIGHTKAAAGMAGLLKALSVCQERTIPAMTDCEQPHSVFGTPLGNRIRLPHDTRAIEHDLPAAAGVSSFGFGGVNCHVVLQGEAPGPVHRTPRRHPAPIPESLRDELLLLAAPTREALAQRLAAVEARSTRLSHAQLTDLAASLPEGTFEFPWRACVVAATPAQLQGTCARARACLLTDMHATCGAGERFEWSAPRPVQPKLALVFPGQGVPLDGKRAAWHARFPLLRDAAARMETLLGDGMDTRVAQAVQAEAAIAGTTLLNALGVGPDVVLGHSVGELSALHAAGMIDADTLRELVRVRAECMHRDAAAGAMLALRATRDAVLQLCAEFDLDIACENAADNFVVAGAGHDVARLRERCASLGVESHPLPARLPFHSRHMERARASFERVFPQLEAQAPKAQVVSTVTGQPLQAGPDLRAHLSRQLTEPVLFASAVAHAQTCDLVIDMGIGPSLSALLQETVGGKARAVHLFGPSLLPLLGALGAWWVRGGSLLQASLFEGRQPRPCAVDHVPEFLASPCGVAAGTPTSQAVALVRPEAVTPTERAAMPAAADAASILRQVLAEATGLEPSAITADARLLTDLHLNSIKARHAIALAAKRLQVTQLPFDLALLARATVEDAVRWLEGLHRETDMNGVAEDVPAGIGPWLRVLSHDWEPAPAFEPAANAAPVRPGHIDDKLLPLPGSVLQRAFHAAAAPANMRLLTLPFNMGATVLQALLEAAQACAAAPGQTLLVLQQAQLANGFVRSLALEHPDRRMCVVECERLDLQSLRQALALHAKARNGYAEMRLRGGAPQVRRLALAAQGSPGPAWTPGSDDVVLFAGGARGIGAAVVRAIAGAYPCRVAVVGRSAPEHEEVAGTLTALRALCPEAMYVQADLASPGDAQAAVDAIRHALGPITAVFHLAAANEPKIVQQLGADDLFHAVDAKVHSLENLLAQLDPAQLRAVVGFGSIIGEFGLAGEAHYALANEWLHKLLLETAAARPGCLVLPVSWSAWDAGMARRQVGALESLARTGLRPLDSGEAVGALLDLLKSPPAGAVIACGRFRAPLSPDDDLVPLQKHRFLEEPRVYYPGIELVADATIGTDTDRYLRDHAPDGLPLLPLVMALEAMASAASGVLGVQVPPTIANLRVHEPVSCPPGHRVVLRTMALVQADGSVLAEIRSDATGFAVRHFSAHLRFEARQAPDAQRPTPHVGETAPADDLLYDGVCFQRGRFRRLGGIGRARAMQCHARTRPAEVRDWFGPLLPQAMVLGDPGARDAVLHAIQVCIPHEVMLPVDVDAVQPGVLDPDQIYDIHAWQERFDGETYTFRVEVMDASGRCVETWRGLRLRRAGTAARGEPVAMPVPLVPSMLERLCADVLGDAGVRAGLCSQGRAAGASEAAVFDATGERLPLWRTDTGALRTPGMFLTSAHADHFTVALARGSADVAVDLQADPGYADETWRDMLDPARLAFAATLQRQCGVAAAESHLLTWCLSECLAKLGNGDWPAAPWGVQRRTSARVAPLLHIEGMGLRVVAGVVRVGAQPAALGFAVALADDVHVAPAQSRLTASSQRQRDAFTVEAK